MADFTNRLNLAKPAGGSSGTIPGDDQADIDVLNANADKIDAAVGVRYVTSTTRPATPYDGQMIKETDTGKLLTYRQATSEWEDSAPGLRGSTALRDLYFGTPATAPLRVALAAKIPRWYNTDKGYEEQYFSQFDDAGSNPKTSALTFGWKGLGRPLLHATAIVPTGGTAVEQGGQVVLAGANTGTQFQGIFTDDFEDYEIEIYGTGGSGTGSSVGFRVVSGTTLEIGATTYGSNVLTAAGGSVSDTYGVGNVGTFGVIGNTGHSFVKGRVSAPKAARQTTWLTDGQNHSTGTQYRCSGMIGNSTSYDGFWLNAGATMNLTVKVYGMGR